MKTVKAIAAGLAVLALGALASTGYLAWRCGYLSWWPFSTHRWFLACSEWSREYLFHGLLIFLASALLAGLVSNFLRGDAKAERKEFGLAKWATLQDVVAAGLIMAPGQRSKLIRVVGRFAGHILTYTGDSHVLCFMGNRSGKGRGIGVPTALSFAKSIVFHDPKGELFQGDPRLKFPGTAGFRAALGHRVVYFNPTDPRSAHYNPLLGVRKGATEVRDLQSLIVILMGRALRDFWERGGGRMVVAIGLHLLYAEPDAEKSLAGLGRFLDLGDAGLERIISTNAHPFAVRTAMSFFPSGDGEDDGDKTKGMRAGLYMTARNFLTPFDDPVVEAVTSGLSHFEPADLVRHGNPTDLYLVVPAGDQELDSVIVSMIISQILRELMGPVLDRTVSGHPKLHDVLLFLDEVAALGPMGDFGKKLPQMPGYRITALLIYQSVKQLASTFGNDSGITENFDVIVAASSTDGDTARWLSALIGNVSEREETVSRSKPVGAWFGGVETRSEREIYRPALDTGAVFEIPADEQLVLKKSHKPIWAKKLRYDEETVFRDRLLPSPPTGDGQGNYPGLRPIPSPWWGLRADEPEAVAQQSEIKTELIDDVPDFQPEW